MALFNKRGGGGPPPLEPPMGPMPPTGVPTDNVLQMRQQGLSNNQIIQGLQQQGFAQSQIFDAMNQADVKGSVEGFPGLAMNEPPPENPMQFQPPSFGGTEERIEEIAEAIIDEKWNELVRSVNKIIDWKERTDQKIAQMEQRFTEIEKNFNSLHQGILGKINEYDQNIVNLGADIKAMEQVFQKVLPSFTENVTELSRITQDIKKKK